MYSKYHAYAQSKLAQIMFVYKLSEWLESRNDYLKKLKELANEKPDAYFYVVGSENFVLDTLYILRENGIEDEKLGKRNIINTADRQNGLEMFQ